MDQGTGKNRYYKKITGRFPPMRNTYPADFCYKYPALPLTLRLYLKQARIPAVGFFSEISSIQS